MTDVAVVVDGDAAAVHPHLTGFDGNEGFFATGEGVVKGEGHSVRWLYEDVRRVIYPVTVEIGTRPFVRGWNRQLTRLSSRRQRSPRLAWEFPPV